MATYTVYRHVELDNVGYGKKRVLKPPGGGSSDIFGAGPEETSPRRIKSHNQSQLGSSFFSETTSNDPSSNGPETPRVTSKPDGNPVTGTGYAADQQNNAMPVQNESGNANSSGSEKSTDISPGTGSMSNKVQRNRVPPGGYSSGLW
ncbi:microtubule-associated protein Jupiter isoform X3 [Belonocnema kinseyi]|uniref:microtubule-associated protein Jupiter isoform X3 n=1 Tax=Belonocnema kinseyi TaxID=2817044 RepID=UPI00143D9D53|nr:microtubule-associated protein Jupiter isoform X3 [Belonocnema kinseyi]